MNLRRRRQIKPRDGRTRSSSVNLQRNIFRCFHPDCRAAGNVLDLWMAATGLPLYEAARATRAAATM